MSYDKGGSLWPPFSQMIYLSTNTANQTVRLSLDEGRLLYSTVFDDYLIILTREENSSTGVDLAQVADIVNENSRITTLTVTTVGLTLAGRYRYEVYGQNSPSNTNPAHTSVVGLVERGYCVLTDSTEYFDAPSDTINDDVINGE